MRFFLQYSTVMNLQSLGVMELKNKNSLDSKTP